MKELTIEEKAKRYDEAIKLVNTKWYYKNQPCFINVSELFPEFKENKDENIKKWLIEYFQEFKSTGIEGFANGLKIDNIIAWLEKQGKQKPIDNIKSKFQVGDWIIFNGITLLVNEVIQGYYRTTSIGGIRNTYDWDIDNAARLWTIEDAKDGDVLVSISNQPFIYNGKYTDFVVGTHIGINFDGMKLFTTKTDNWTMNKGVKPATKEECDLLFQRMKEDGYKWNTDTKVLIKL